MPKRQRHQTALSTWPRIYFRSTSAFCFPPPLLPSLKFTTPLTPAFKSHHQPHPPCILSMSAPPFNTRIAAIALSALLFLPSSVLSLTEPQKLVAEAWRVVDQSYVDRSFNKKDWFKIRMRAVKRAYTSSEDAYKAIRDMLHLLDDPYTRFLTPQQYISLTSTATGEIAGVGVELFPARVDDSLKVTAAVDDSPAARAGVRSADIITLINGEQTQSLTPDEAAARIRGKPGTSVVLTVVHEQGTGEEQSLSIVRENLKLKSVKASILRPGELYVKIKQFNSNTAADVKDALEQNGNQTITKIILDLRNNSGGYFPGGVDVARLFLKGGKPIVYVLDKNSVQDEMDSISDGIFTDIPIRVLVNGATASASEILAGALKDNGRAKLLGEQTFGKGVVQTVSQLSDGSGLAVTIARYETPSHKNINKVGIEPDIIKPCSLDADIHSCFPDEL